MDLSNQTSGDFQPSRRFQEITCAENGVLLGDESANLITCIEDQSLSSALRDGVRQHFAPATRIEQYLAGSIAEDLRRKARDAGLETPALSAAIERDWETVDKECPGAHPALRALKAKPR